ncbi:tRNA-splicing endonuclease subunit Sen2-2-like [Cornus florida]|uniref:tRNA-splicing endonuclease subunit Sen2-2-like n=1 Tax=Cornus florida TaxID=4283 RepID=UPI0028978FC9|nr:tRNA-splicing endonuclease subunit Sen2-2-like [Cornus florida]
MGPRGKGKGSEAKALADRSHVRDSLTASNSLIQLDSHGLLSGCSVLLGAETEQTDFLNRACFGRPIITTEKDKQWFQLGMEEAFYLFYSLKCLKIIGEDQCTKNNEELWSYMKSKEDTFPEYLKAYSRLRNKNWVVRSGSQNGVDFVAYRHHPALVHSEYAVLVLSGDGDANDRLKVWSDFQCTLRLCGSVAKTLLVLNIFRNNTGAVSPSCL